MAKLYIDAGTSWSKVLEIYEDEATSSFASVKSIQDYIMTPPPHSTPCFYRNLIFPTKQLNSLNIKFDGATGHMAKNCLKSSGVYQNEMLSLAYGAKKLLSEEELKDATIIDLGSRDIKWVRFIDGKYKDLDWNGSCGSVTGATVEMLSKFYNVNVSEIPPNKERIPVTCGVFAMEKIMDEIVNDIPAETAIAKYIHGIAYNAWTFAHSPEKIYLSGGFCLNKCFIESLKFYCEVIPMGRTVLLEGLY